MWKARSGWYGYFDWLLIPDETHGRSVNKFQAIRRLLLPTCITRILPEKLYLKQTSSFTLLEWDSITNEVIRMPRILSHKSHDAYMTFDLFELLKVIAYLDQIYEKVFPVKFWTKIYVTCPSQIRARIVLEWFIRYCYFVFKNLQKVPVEKGSMINIIE
jgi:hypothetical protein